MSTTLSDIFVKPTVKFYKRRILKDPFQLAVRQWKRDGGNQRLRYNYQLDSNSTVLDVGGYHGEFADEMIQRFGCRVIVFEPMPKFYQQCKDRFANQPLVTVLDYGLGSEDLELNLGTSADASSFHRMNDAENSVKAQVRDIASVWQELGLANVDLMKINIEGGEYPLLDRLIQSGLVSQVKDIQVQFHDFIKDAPAQRDAIRSQLSKSHNETWCYTFVWENWSLKTAETTDPRKA